MEPLIRHMNTDGRTALCALKGALGDTLHVVLNSCGHNIRIILANLTAIRAEILAAFCAIFAHDSRVDGEKTGFRTHAA